MAENLLGAEVVCHVGVIVEDIETTSGAWADLLGVEVPAARWTACRSWAPSWSC